MELTDITALVTGANRGIGRALVTALLDRGARTVYAGMRHREDPGDPRVRPILLDITDPGQVEAAADAAGDVTLLINNAGSLAFGDALGGSLSDVEDDWRTNYLGTLAMTRAFVPVLRRNGGGAIVNILTIVALAPVPAIGGYSASKAAAASATVALRGQLAGTGITVHGVYPGAVDTDMSRPFPIPKTSAADAAAEILDGVAAGDETILPDAMARDGYRLWRDDPYAFERQMALLGA